LFRPAVRAKTLPGKEVPKVSETQEKSENIQSVELALSVLETLAGTQGDIGVTALAGALGTTKSRIYRHLRTLVNLGYIQQNPVTHRYRIGSRLIALGKAASDSADLAGVAQGPMRKLRDTTGQAASLAQVERDGIRILQTVPGTMQIEVGVRPGSLLGFTNSAQGKVALAAMDPARREQILAQALPVPTAHSISDVDEMRQHIAQISLQGWATAPNEAMLGLNALACPIFGAEGELAGTLAIVSLTQFIGTPPDTDQVAAVRLAAAEISAALGYVPS
jgi:DNA-binding IclR family transcriptional regulator